ncbi:hypothetical protein PTTG_00825, partial [Puccinia triticina 1-1 BBBD Race 1]
MSESQATGAGSSSKMIKIQPQDRNLKFDGTRIEAFLRQYELAARLDGASEEDKVLQITAFLEGADIQDAVWDMSGYTSNSWSTLREQMIERWGQVDLVRYTVADLQALKDSWSAKGGISTLDDYRSFKSVFDVTLSYLVRYQHLSSEDLAADHFFFSFSLGFQHRIKSFLVKAKKMTKTLDGRYRLPALAELKAAVKSEMEEEVAFTSEQAPPQPNVGSSTDFKAANDVMQQIEANRRPKDAPVSDKPPATVDEISRMLQSFEQRLEKKFASKTIPTTSGTSRDPRGPLPKASTASTSPEFRATCGTLEPWYPPAISSQSFSGTYEADPARKKHESPKPYKAPMVPPSVARKPARKASKAPAESDGEDMDDEPELFERIPAAPAEDALPSTADASEPISKSKSPAPKVRFERGVTKDHPHMVEGMLKKIFDLPVPGVTVSELLASSPSVAEGMKKWVSKRRVEIGAEDLKVSSGTLLAEGLDTEGSSGDARLYSCPLGFLPCLIGDEESPASPLIDSGSQLNLISDAMANKFC